MPVDLGFGTVEVHQIVSLGFCIGNGIGASVLLFLSILHLSSDVRSIPTKDNINWSGVLTQLIAVASITLCLSLVTIWAVLRRSGKWMAMITITFSVMIAAGGIYYMHETSRYIKTNPVNADELFNQTLTLFNKHKGTKWVPSWLNDAQSQSKICCGIRTYKDWYTFWPESHRVPNSCCKNATCPTDLYQLPYPLTPASFVKVDQGCSKEISKVIMDRIKYMHVFLTVLCCIFCTSVGYYILLYVILWLWRSDSARIARSQKSPGKGQVFQQDRTKEQMIKARVGSPKPNNPKLVNVNADSMSSMASSSSGSATTKADGYSAFFLTSNMSRRAEEVWGDSYELPVAGGQFKKLPIITADVTTGDDTNIYTRPNAQVAASFSTGPGPNPVGMTSSLPTTSRDQRSTLDSPTSSSSSLGSIDGTQRAPITNNTLGTGIFKFAKGPKK